MQLQKQPGEEETRTSCIQLPLNSGTHTTRGELLQKSPSPKPQKQNSETLTRTTMQCFYCTDLCWISEVYCVWYTKLPLNQLWNLWNEPEREEGEVGDNELEE